MKNFVEKDNALFFLGGIVAGIIGLKALKTNKARDLAVSGIAKGLIAKDSIAEKVTNLKEDAEDLYAEAKVQADGESEKE